MSNAKCPRCGEEKLTITYTEHNTYPIKDIPADPVDYVEIDESGKDTSEAECIHVCCDACDAVWDDLFHFSREFMLKKAVPS